MDIEACANANRDAWTQLADDLQTQLPALAAFRAACMGTKLGTDVIASKLLHFVTTGEVVSTYEYDMARGGRAAAESKLSGTWGQRRLAFETAIGSARRTLYGTLDLPGCIGDARYGPFRLVAEPHAEAPIPIVLPHNSASGYAHDNVANEAELCADSATWDRRAEVGTVRRGKQATSSFRDDWPALLTSEDEAGTIECDLVEVVLREGRRPLSSIETVRIGREHMGALADRYARDLLESRAMRDEDIAAFGALSILVDEGTLNLEVIG